MLGSAAITALEDPRKAAGSMSAEVRTILRRSTSTGVGSFFASGVTIIILPARSWTFSEARPVTATFKLPSSTTIFTALPGRFSIMIVVPVIEAVTDAARIRAPPRFFGTWSSIEPRSRFSSRVPGWKLKKVSAPSRVRVLS